jgi:hypothetical protein
MVPTNREQSEDCAAGIRCGVYIVTVLLVLLRIA